MGNIYFDFYGFSVEVSSVDTNIKGLLLKDFSFFKTTELNAILKVKTKKCDNLADIIPRGLTSKKQSINSVTYDDKNIRYNDYYGDIITVFDYKLESCSIHYTNNQKLHEILYLVILSRQTKWFDKNGLHKIHAMSVNAGNKNLILMMPMKGGKSTTFLKFIEKTEHGLLSDDTPIVDGQGRVKKFPIRFGIESIERYEKKLGIEKSFVYKMSREQYGEKALVDMAFYEDRTSFNEGDHQVLVHGVRSTYEEPELVKVSRFKMMKILVEHMIIGIGLPMVIEYFVRSNLLDHAVNIKILISRIRSAFKLTKKSDNYICYLTSDIDKNFEKLNSLLVKN